MSKKYGCSFFEDYEIESWLPRLGSVPKDLIASHDRSESCEMDLAAAVRLENGQYALIVERGCSCYSSEDADIELFPTEERVMAQYQEWLRKI